MVSSQDIVRAVEGMQTVLNQYEKDLSALRLKDTAHVMKISEQERKIQQLETQLKELTK